MRRKPSPPDPATRALFDFEPQWAEQLELIGTYAIRDLADTTAYDALKAQDALDAQRAAGNIVAEIFRLAGCSESAIEANMLAWTGTKLPVC